MNSSLKKFVIFLAVIPLVTSVFTFNLPDAEGTSIDTRITSISIWDMIIFQGNGFHRLHNVEITISQDGIVEPTLLTKTTDRGDLFMPLIITDLSPGKYDVVATDTIHTAITSFEI